MMAVRIHFIQNYPKDSDSKSFVNLEGEKPQDWSDQPSSSVSENWQLRKTQMIMNKQLGTGIINY